MNSLIENSKQQIIELCKQHHVKELYVFGSAVRDDFNEKSDVDFLYEFDTSKVSVDRNKSVINYADNYFDLKFGLEDILNREVDLIEYKEFKNPYFQKAVQQSKTLLYAA
ncbi:MAG: nucleotidyltransferase domain-containing protein [Bacteroidetes bacterium]|nr:nucleotidyltransferase domain-containing protein [Bacteroidota bacterium]MBS1591293.1 nucleotidyltransferase domain-containing protein [Bacteroidota bacterium]MBS1639156.1 nucleotidyltransferase domain-containing protein [Bacteroidota bacterium]